MFAVYGFSLRKPTVLKNSGPLIRRVVSNADTDARSGEFPGEHERPQERAGPDEHAALFVVTGHDGEPSSHQKDRRSLGLYLSHGLTHTLSLPDFKALGRHSVSYLKQSVASFLRISFVSESISDTSSIRWRRFPPR